MVGRIGGGMKGDLRPFIVHSLATQVPQSTQWRQSGNNLCQSVRTVQTRDIAQIRRRASNRKISLDTLVETLIITFGPPSGSAQLLTFAR